MTKTSLPSTEVEVPLISIIMPSLRFHHPSKSLALNVCAVTAPLTNNPTNRNRIFIVFIVLVIIFIFNQIILTEIKLITADRLNFQNDLYLINLQAVMFAFINSWSVFKITG